MKVSSEHYSKNLLAAGQGLAISRLVAEEFATTISAAGPSWLTKWQSGTVTRYRPALVAAKNVMRMAKAPDFHSYILRRDGRPVGLGSIMLGQWIIGPGKDGDRTQYGGVSDVDYWLQQRFADDEELHDTVAAELIKRSGHLALSRGGTVDYSTEVSGEAGGIAIDTGISYTATNSMIAVVPVGHPNPPYGLMRQFEAMGEPARLTTPPLFQDTYNVVKSGRTAQLYVLEQPIAA